MTHGCSIAFGVWGIGGQKAASRSVSGYPSLRLTKLRVWNKTASIKGSKVSIPRAALDEQVPCHQPSWDITQGPDHTEPLPGWESNFWAALHLFYDICEGVYQFFCGGRCIYFTFLGSNKSICYKVLQQQASNNILPSGLLVGRGKMPGSIWPLLQLSLHAGLHSLLLLAE